MKILALDTATDACSAALWIDDEVIERYELAPRRHATLVLPMIEAVLAEAGVTLAGLDGLAFGCGPGSFTGIRIAASVIQGIAFAVDLPVVPVSTLATIARGVMDDHGAVRVAVALDARKSEIYWGCYEDDGVGGVWRLDEERVAAADQVALPTAAEWAGAGSGWDVYAASLSRLPLAQRWPDAYPRAGDVAALSVPLHRNGAGVAAEQALPVYLRNEVVVRPSAK